MSGTVRLCVKIKDINRQSQCLRTQNTCTLFPLLYMKKIRFQNLPEYQEKVQIKRPFSQWYKTEKYTVYFMSGSLRT